MERFVTERLEAERLRPGHLEDLARLHRDPRVMATLGGHLFSREETRGLMDRFLVHWEAHGFGMWVFRERGTPRFAGRGHLRRVFIGGGEEVELGYALPADCWGRGLATEMARALAGLALGPLRLPDIVAFTRPDHTASRRVMEKAGFTYERDTVWGERPHVLYRLRAPSPFPPPAASG